MTDPAALAIQRVSFKANGLLIIDGISCRVDAGSLTALVGPNGAGKSSLLHLIAGADRPSSGSIALGGIESTALRRRERARFSALVEQNASTELELSVLDVVSLGRTPHINTFSAPNEEDELIVHEAIRRVGARHLRARQFSNLSGGERQRVLLARALAQQPSLLLVDEPTNHLDVSAQLSTLELMRTLASQGIAVVAAMHDLSLAARYADQIIVLKRGQVVSSGSPAETLTPAVILDVYGVQADLLTHPADGSLLIAFSPRQDSPPSRSFESVSSGSDATDYLRRHSL
jgi:iron complex transport system ATP-binding protein